MLRASLIVALLSTLAATTTHAWAADAPRRGLYSALALGPAFVAGEVDYASDATSFHESFAGGGGDLHFAMGYAPVDGFAIAVGGGTSITDAEVRVPRGSRDVFSAWTAGALIDWYPHASGATHIELGLGYCVSTFLAGGRDSGGQASQPGLGGDGAFGRAGVGYVFRSRTGFGIGPLLAVSMLRTRNSAAHTRASSVALLLQLSWF